MKVALSLKLTVVARLVRMRFDESVERINVTRTHWTVIATAARLPGATQKTIASELQISEVSAGRLIDKLCGEGLLDRRVDDDDRRAYRVYVTRAVRPLLHELGDVAEANERRAFAGLTAADLAEMDRLLDIIQRNVAMASDPTA